MSEANATCPPEAGGARRHRAKEPDASGLVVTPTDPLGQRVDLFSGPVHVVSEGPSGAPAWLLVHGAPGSVRDFRYLGPALAREGLRAIRVDMPGFGGTPFSTWPATDATRRAGFLAALASALGLLRFGVLGHSAGGATALLSAALFPKQVRGLALVNSVGVRRHRGVHLAELVARPLAFALRQESLAAHVVPRVRAEYRRMGFRAVESMEAEELATHADLVASLDFRAHRRAARQVQCPVVVASSEDDPLVEAEVSHGLVGAFSPSTALRHLHFRHGGHYLQKHEAVRIARELASL